MVGEREDLEHRVGELETEQCLIKSKLALILQTMMSSTSSESATKRISSQSIEQIIKEIHQWAMKLCLKRDSSGHGNV